MREPNDWRLQGQEKYLKGASLHWQAYRRRSERWDHDHCVFCSAKFMTPEFAATLHEGYTTEDEYHWVCQQCYEDFKDLFEWTT